MRMLGWIFNPFRWAEISARAEILHVIGPLKYSITNVKFIIFLNSKVFIKSAVEVQDYV